MARNNYIKQNIATYGSDWIVCLRPEDIQRSAKRIAKELVKGDFDLQNEGNYFLNPKFLDNLIIAYKNELETQSLYLTALSFYRQYYPATNNISGAINHVDVLCRVYSTLLQKLNAVKYNGNIGPLVDISALLFQYRIHLT